MGHYWGLDYNVILGAILLVLLCCFFRYCPVTVISEVGVAPCYTSPVPWGCCLLFKVWCGGLRLTLRYGALRMVKVTDNIVPAELLFPCTSMFTLALPLSLLYCVMVDTPLLSWWPLGSGGAHNSDFYPNEDHSMTLR